MAAEIVLITGGCGFLGQHIVRELQEHDDSIAEIRVLDLTRYENNLNHLENKPISSYITNISDKESMKDAFKNVTCVFHCAAYVSYEFPPDEEALNKINIEGTRNVIELCIENSVPYLVFTSSTEVTTTPYLKFPFGFFSTVVNQTEARVKSPTDLSELIFPGYAASKLKAEEIVIAADNTDLKNGQKLRTVALRPTLMYGEEDYRLIPSILKVGDYFDGNIIQLAGVGGKQQITYAGNAAWGHVCAKRTLQEEPKGIAGLPVFITDDTPIRDITKFSVEMINKSDSIKKYNIPWWYISSIISFIAAIIIEGVFKLLYPSFTKVRLSVSPKGIVVFLGSILLYSRLRASIHMRYYPIYNWKESEKRSLLFYSSKKSMTLKVK